MKKCILLLFSCFALLSAVAQKHIYDVVLFGNKIGQTVVERIDKGNGEVQYKLNSSSEVTILFNKKTSAMVFDVLYKDGKLMNSYVKNVKDGVTEIINILWQETQYVIKKGVDTMKLAQAVNFSAIQLYFTEPVGMTRIFSERIGNYCSFKNTAPGVYECKLDNGVNNIYKYRNGVLYELEMSKGASVYMRLVR
ncbi:MAG: DUF6134 family protein [Chitinophagales bacterium]